MAWPLPKQGGRRSRSVQLPLVARAEREAPAAWLALGVGWRPRDVEERRRGEGEWSRRSASGPLRAQPEAAERLAQREAWELPVMRAASERGGRSVLVPALEVQLERTAGDERQVRRPEVLRPRSAWQARDGSLGPNRS